MLLLSIAKILETSTDPEQLEKALELVRKWSGGQTFLDNINVKRQEKGLSILSLAQSKKKLDKTSQGFYDLAPSPVKNYLLIEAKLKELQGIPDPDSLELKEIQKLLEKRNNIRKSLGLAQYDLTTAQLREFKDLTLKPLKYPGDKDPAQNETICPICNGAISEKDDVPYCENCGKVVDPKRGDPWQRKVLDKGERPNIYGPKSLFVVPFQRAAQNKNKLKKKKKKDHAEYDVTTVKDEYTSDPFEQCIDPRRKRYKYDDKKEEIFNSCRDLEIDG